MVAPGIYEEKVSLSLNTTNPNRKNANVTVFAHGGSDKTIIKNIFEFPRNNGQVNPWIEDQVGLWKINVTNLSVLPNSDSKVTINGRSLLGITRAVHQSSWQVNPDIKKSYLHETNHSSAISTLKNRMINNQVLESIAVAGQWTNGFYYTEEWIDSFNKSDSDLYGTFFTTEDIDGEKYLFLKAPGFNPITDTVGIGSNTNISILGLSNIVFQGFRINGYSGGVAINGSVEAGNATLRSPPENIEFLGNVFEGTWRSFYLVNGVRNFRAEGNLMISSLGKISDPKSSSALPIHIAMMKVYQGLSKGITTLNASSNLSFLSNTIAGMQTAIEVQGFDSVSNIDHTGLEIKYNYIANSMDSHIELYAGGANQIIANNFLVNGFSGIKGFGTSDRPLSLDVYNNVLIDSNPHTQSSDYASFLFSGTGDGNINGNSGYLNVYNNYVSGSICVRARGSSEYGNSNYFENIFDCNIWLKKPYFSYHEQHLFPKSNTGASDPQAELDEKKNKQPFFAGNKYFGNSHIGQYHARTLDIGERSSWLDGNWDTVGSDGIIIPLNLTDTDGDGVVTISDVTPSDWKYQLFDLEVAFNLKDNEEIRNDLNQPTRYYPDSSSILSKTDFCHSVTASSTFNNQSNLNSGWTLSSGREENNFTYPSTPPQYKDNGVFWDFLSSGLTYPGIPIPIVYDNSFNINRTIASVDRAVFNGNVGPGFFNDNNLCQNLKWLAAPGDELGPPPE
ncbi:MAG: hypothetical protein CME61_05765 [Halobacteriovoraceae bacterium]|nr:hypothetical protein [Halobacteriovoraceae bacterium]